MHGKHYCFAPRYGVVWGQLDDEDATRVGVFVTELRLELETEALAFPMLRLLILMTPTVSLLTAQTQVGLIASMYLEP